jgi:hypothetical protein
VSILSKQSGADNALHMLHKQKGNKERTGYGHEENFFQIK